MAFNWELFSLCLCFLCVLLVRSISHQQTVPVPKPAPPSYQYTSVSPTAITQNGHKPWTKQQSDHLRRARHFSPKSSPAECHKALSPAVCWNKGKIWATREWEWSAFSAHPAAMMESKEGKRTSVSADTRPRDHHHPVFCIVYGKKYPAGIHFPVVSDRDQIAGLILILWAVSFCSIPKRCKTTGLGPGELGIIRY